MTGCQSLLVISYYKHLFYILRDWKFIWSAKPGFIIHFEVTWDLYPTVYSVWLVPLREQCVRQPWISTLVLLPPRLSAHQERKKTESMWKLEDWEECWEILSSEEDMAIAILNSWQLCFPAQNLHQTKSAQNSGGMGLPMSRYSSYFGAIADG